MRLKWERRSKYECTFQVYHCWDCTVLVTLVSHIDYHQQYHSVSFPQLNKDRHRWYPHCATLSVDVVNAVDALTRSSSWSCPSALSSPVFFLQDVSVDAAKEIFSGLFCCWALKPLQYNSGHFASYSMQIIQWYFGHCSPLFTSLLESGWRGNLFTRIFRKKKLTERHVIILYNFSQQYLFCEIKKQFTNR